MADKSKSRKPQPKVSIVCVGGFGAKALEQLAKILAPRIESGAADAIIADSIARESRFTKVSADGTLLPKSATDWEGVYDAEQNLVFGRKLLPGRDDWSDSLKKASAAKLCGQPARAPTVRERFNLSDFERTEPALDTDYFDPSEKDVWEWTSTPSASSPSDYAWFVFLGDGGAYRGDQSNDYCVRAVCAGQLFGFGLQVSK